MNYDNICTSFLEENPKLPSILYFYEAVINTMIKNNNYLD